ncbi:MAG TPA: DUF5700 domain-containing putative Zn-dependent protease [Thermoanaerobaculia bacterium]|nr:DUF5700 domain-containing putative Zn-dependent protease [Thermoanaerobaculia bacterium]
MTTRQRADRILGAGVLALLASAWPAFPAADPNQAARPDPLVQVRIVTDEADVALAIVGELRETGTVKPASWDRLWQSQGFVRLKKRQESFGVKDVEQGFREFLTSDAALASLDDLRRSVADWKHLDVTAAARRAASYLPAGLPLKATLYPVIKKSENSFVFELATDPAMFFHVDPKKAPAQLENTLAHELHHVGLAGCPKPPGLDKLPAAQQKVFDYLGGFGEGLAVLAASGGPDVHPHATDGADPWLVWERDVANFNADLRRLEAFFREVLAGRLAGQDADKRLFTFIDTDDVPQGAFYTVGWKMAAMIERARGRDALVRTVCDPRSLLTAYNEVAAAHPRGDGEALAAWSGDFLAALRGEAPR